MKNGWKKLLEEEVIDNDEVETNEIEELSEIIKQKPALKEIDLIAELNTEVPDAIIFGEGGEISETETQGEDSEEEVQKKKLSTKQVVEINHHIECLRNIIQQNDPDDFRANSFVNELVKIANPYKILLAVRNQQKVQPTITSFLQKRLPTEKRKQNLPHTLTDDRASFSKRPRIESANCITRPFPGIPGKENSQKGERFPEVFNHLRDMEEFNPFSNEEARKEDHNVEEVEQDERNDKMDSEVGAIPPKQLQTEPTERELEKDQPCSSAPIKSNQIKMPSNYTVKDIWMGYNCVRESYLSFKDVKIAVELRQINGNETLHHYMQDESADQLICITGKFKMSSFKSLERDMKKPSIRSAVYFVVPVESAKNSVMKLFQYMEERDSGLSTTFKSFSNTEVCLGYAITFHNCGFF